MDLPPKLVNDALAQPTRAQLFTALSDLRRPAGTEELAEGLGLHPNGVRAHLERLRQAGLVVRERTRQGRGRPRDMWLVAPGAQPGGDPPTSYANLGRWLSRLITGGKVGPRKIETTGREIGRELAPVDGDLSAEETMHTTLVSLGFQPQRETPAHGRLTYRLGNCPYRESARGNQEVVCTLHRGITQGLLDVLAPETKLTGFVPRDPHQAGCLIEMRGGLAGDQ